MNKFVTFEGCDGVGKTAQLEKLKQYCRQFKPDAVFTREPGGSSIAEKIRGVILDAGNDGMTDVCEAFLYAAARAQHLNDIVVPALKAGKTVFCDRYVHSSLAYQGAGRGLGVAWVGRLNELATGGVMPDCTVFFDLPPDKCFVRKGGADCSDRIETGGREFHRKIYDGYKEIIAGSPERFEVVDASGTIEEIFEDMLSRLKKRGVL